MGNYIPSSLARSTQDTELSLLTRKEWHPCSLDTGPGTLGIGKKKRPPKWVFDDTKVVHHLRKDTHHQAQLFIHPPFADNPAPLGKSGLLTSTSGGTLCPLKWKKKKSSHNGERRLNLFSITRACAAAVHLRWSHLLRNELTSENVNVTSMHPQEVGLQNIWQTWQWDTTKVKE